MTDSAPAPATTDSAPAAEHLITDFTAKSSDLDWFVVNDNVMGGRSNGSFELEKGELDFTGRTDTRGGGFSSIRTGPMQLDLSRYDGIRLRVLADGRRYTWRLTTDARWRGRQVSYWADFDTRNDGWSTVSIPFSGFIPRFRGSPLDGPALDAGEISGMGLMIYDKRDGPFALRLASVEAYSDQPTFALSQYRWHKRVLVVSAPDAENEELIKQQEALALTANAFTDRDMVLVTLLDGAVSTAGDRKLTPGDIIAARTCLDIKAGSFSLRLIGKDGSVKLTRESATPMAEIYALIDSMPMRQRENPDRRALQKDFSDAPAGNNTHVTE